MPRPKPLNPIQETWSNALPSTPIPLAIIGGTGLGSLPGYTPVETLTISTPWGETSSPITILEHRSASATSATQVAFLARHGLHHTLAPHEIPNRANIAALRKIGVRTIIAFSAVGSLKEEIAPCDFVIPDQVIDRTKGIRPWTFFEHGVVGHTAFADPFDIKLSKVVNGTLSQMVKSREGVEASSSDAVYHHPLKVHAGGLLVCIEGPQFSTRAESNLYRAWGGAVINMSALPEAKLAAEAEISYAMVCMATDYDCWRIDGEGGVQVEMVMANMKKNADSAKLVAGALIEELSKAEHGELVQSAHLRGGMKIAGSCTKEEARGREQLEKLEWMFEEDYFSANPQPKPQPVMIAKESLIQP